MGAVRVAYTLEQCWHRVPGGTGVAAMRVAEAMAGEGDVTLIGVAGRHKHVPSEPWSPVVPIAHLPVVGRCCTTCGCAAAGRRSSVPPGRSTWPMRPP